MQTMVDLAGFRNAVKRVTPAMGNRLPIHLGLRLHVGGGLVTVEAHDGEMHFGAFVLAETGPDEQAVVVPGRSLGRFVERADGPVVRIDVGGGYSDVRFTCGAAELTLRQFTSDDWHPNVPALSGLESLERSTIDRLRSILFAASTDPDRNVLTAVHVHGTTATATDSRRLAQVKLDFPLKECLIPAGFLKHALGSGEKVIRLRFDGNRVVLHDSGGFWSSPQMGGTYPEVSAVADRPTIGRIELPLAWLRAAVEHMSVFESVRHVRLITGEDSTAHLIGVDVDLGRIDDVADFVGDWYGVICFFLDHLRDAVRAVAGDVFAMDINAPLSPVLIRSEGLFQMLVPRQCAEAPA